MPVGYACEEDDGCGFADSGRPSAAAIGSSVWDGSGEPLRGVVYVMAALRLSSRGCVRDDIVSERGDEGEPNIAERTL